MGKIIAFSNQKGGVGKTTTCVSLAHYVATKGNKVLIIDMDSQGNATTGLGFEKKELEKSVYNVLIQGEGARDNIVNTHIEGLDILPANIDLAGAEVELVYKRMREKILSVALEEVRADYDYIFIDCPPSLGLLTINALAAADSVIIPILSEYYALEGLSQLMNTISLVKQHLNPAVTIEGVILTMFDGRSLISKQIAEEIKKYFNKKLYDTTIPRNVRMVESTSHGMPIGEYDPKCRGAEAYSRLAEEFLSKQKK